MINPLKRVLGIIYLFSFLICLLCGTDLKALPAPPPLLVQGTVRSEDGTPVPGVNVRLKGTTNAVVTDEKGNYRITVAQGTGTLTFTHVSYTSREVPINGRTVINVSLTMVQGGLNEVAIIGYGTQEKRAVTGSISSVKSDEIALYNVNTFQSALQGRMPGVEMYESNGVPGSAVNVRIRGLNTINGSAGPLYVVDGVPVFTGGGVDGDAPLNNGFDAGSSQTNVMTDINPNDIESIDVLKDAAATAIYGARGSGGVILITTKRGKAGRTAFNVNYITGFSRISKVKQLLNGPQLLDILDEAYRNTFYSTPSNINLPLPATPIPAITNFTRGQADTTNNDPFDVVLQTGMFRELTLSASNGSDNTKYYLSGTYRDNVATIKGTGMKQYNFKLNLDHNISKYIRLGLSVTPSFNKEKRLGSSNTINLGGYGAALSTNLPIYPLYNTDGTYFNPWTNPVAYQDRDLFTGDNKRTRISESLFVEADLSKDLKLKSIFQREDFNQVAPTYISGILRITNDVNISPFANDQTSRLQHQNSYGYINSMENYLTYKKVIGKKHALDGVLGMRFSSNATYYEAMYGDNVPNSNFIYPSQAARIDQNIQTGVQGDMNANLGYFLRAQYGFKRKYLLSLVVNRDGNSRFGDRKRFGTFPALSAGWVASDESFLKRSKVISFLKIRGSFGLTGNAGGIGNNSSKTTWQSGSPYTGYMGTIGNAALQPANANLHWEKGIKYDAGIDMRLLNNRLSTTIDYYKNITKEMLLSIPTPVNFGYNAAGSDLTFLENRGSLYNEGIEFSANANILKGAFKWNASFNISHNITRITDLGGIDPNTVSAASGDVQLYVGKNAPVYYLIESAGVDPATGGELVHDKDGNTVLASSLNAQQLNAARKPQYDKSPAPKFYGGLGNNFDYKGFSLSVFFSYRVGNYLLDAGERVMSYVGNISVTNNSTVPNIFLGNLPVSILNRWTTPGQITDIPKVYYNDPVNNILRNRNTTRFLSDASYIRLKNVQLSYALPPELLSRLRLKSARLNITGQNLFLLTRFKGIDPESVTIQTNYRERNLGYGIIRNVVPQSRTLTLGLNIGF